MLYFNWLGLSLIDGGNIELALGLCSRTDKAPFNVALEKDYLQGCILTEFKRRSCLWSRQHASQTCVSAYFSLHRTLPIIPKLTEIPSAVASGSVPLAVKEGLTG